MDRFVWLIAITVISNLIIDISTVTASDKDSSTTDNKADTVITLFYSHFLYCGTQNK